MTADVAIDDRVAADPAAEALGEMLALLLETNNVMGGGSDVRVTLTASEAALIASMRILKYAGHKMRLAMHEPDRAAYRRAQDLYDRVLPLVRRDGDALGFAVEPR